MAPYLKESELKRLILDWLSLHRFFHWRNNTGAYSARYKGKERFIRFGDKGSPDIFVVRRGQCYGLELKVNGNDQSQAQVCWQSEFEAAGGKYAVIRELRDVENLLK
jgi:hypothetical protein